MAMCPQDIVWTIADKGPWLYKSSLIQNDVSLWINERLESHHKDNVSMQLVNCRMTVIVFVSVIFLIVASNGISVVGIYLDIAQNYGISYGEKGHKLQPVVDYYGCW